MFCLTHTQNAMKYRAPATVLCDVETQRSTEENFLERFLFFFHLGVFLLYNLRESSALPPFGSTFPHVWYITLFRVSCSQNMQFSLFFLAEMSAGIWWIWTRSLELSTLMLHSQMCACFWRQKSHEPSMGKIDWTQDAHYAKREGMCFLRETKDIWLALFNGVSVLRCGVLRVLKCLGANNELLRT